MGRIYFISNIIFIKHKNLTKNDYVIIAFISNIVFIKQKWKKEMK